jgi:hypothetical protein
MERKRMALSSHEQLDNPHCVTLEWLEYLRTGIERDGSNNRHEIDQNNM